MYFDYLVQTLHKIKTRHYVAMLDEGRLPLRPGVARLIAEARAAGLRLGIATTTTPDNVGALLRNGFAPDAESWFDIIAAGDIVPAKKPAPDIYQWVLARTGWQAAQCLALEDSRNGLRASLAAGIRTLVTVSHYTVDEDFSGAVAVLSDLGEPGRPCRVLAGDGGGQAWVDVAALRRWHGEAPG
jgi:HAD superfamily hydrolase (TIGR01509 family)